ncbi:class I SAM-dependent methyltransferase [Aquicella lusitana]|uniref:Methyltransferase family protein n=1 Tax=Aquicella lusitana TaxID=254246 RepID=A0A370GN35_9COXI|nr:class I SAM-dependent methyltransferase [Aquicella lusitana]RDI45128.1 methyltransferase family protein [Aquicella lusitana]VVC72802.1 putative S-adenosylmethionine-dependent methyltransferase [Aquicella lusitana]
MKLCLACEREFNQESWVCPFCSWMPSLIEGFPAFSPELANENDGFSHDAHHFLDKMQENSFWFRVRNRIIQDAIRKYFPLQKNVLEIGCGSGYVLGGIREVLPSAKITATEIYSHCLHYATKRVRPPAEFLQVDARKLPFKNEFDLVGAFDVLEHIEEHEVVINNIHQSLKPSGGLILTVPQHPWLWSKVDDISYHKRRYTRNQLASILRQHGFNIKMNTSFVFFLLPLMLAQRLIRNKNVSQETSRILSLPKILDKAFESILELERKAIHRRVNFPIGGSRFVVAMKPPE